MATLRVLYDALRHRAGLGETGGAWVHQMLPGGALFALRRQEGAVRLELRIARQHEPLTDTGRERWATEIETFLKHFRITPVDGMRPCEDAGRFWLVIPNQPSDEGKAVVRLLELRIGEVEPGRAICHACHDLMGRTRFIDHQPGGPKSQLCPECEAEVMKARLDPNYRRA